VVDRKAVPNGEAALATAATVCAGGVASVFRAQKKSARRRPRNGGLFYPPPMHALAAAIVTVAVHTAGISLVVLEVCGSPVSARSMRPNASVAVRTPFEPILIEAQRVFEANLNPLAPDTHLAGIWENYVRHTFPCPHSPL
jgi:hypothetical protein